MDNLQEIGLGAALMLAMFIIRDAVNGLMRRRQNGTSGDKSAEYWEMTIRRIVEEALEDRIQGHLKMINESLVTLIRWKGGD